MRPGSPAAPESPAQGLASPGERKRPAWGSSQPQERARQGQERVQVSEAGGTPVSEGVLGLLRVSEEGRPDTCGQMGAPRDTAK